MDANVYTRGIIVLVASIASAVIVVTNQPDAAIKVALLVTATQSLVNFLSLERIHALVNSQSVRVIEQTAIAAHAAGRDSVLAELAAAGSHTNKTGDGTTQ